MSVIFTKGATVVTIEDGYTAATEQQVPIPGTVADETQGGTIIAQDIGPDRTMWFLEFVGLSLTDKNLLRAFFLDTIRGRYNTFIFTDRDSANYTVRWWNEWAIKPDSAAPQTSWSGQVHLRQET